MSENLCACERGVGEGEKELETETEIEGKEIERKWTAECKFV